MNRVDKTSQTRTSRFVSGSEPPAQTFMGKVCHLQKEILCRKIHSKINMSANINEDDL